MNSGFWNKKTVFLTGHTGFKGGWIGHWLCELGANVHGYALAASPEPNFFGVTKLQERLCTSTIADIRDQAKLSNAIRRSKPDVIFHMAAQPLVRESYANPVETLAVNVMGTANLLEAARMSDTVTAIINVTTDKCYANQEWFWPYRENDRLGGRDPYSASKACAELVAIAYRESFFAEGHVQLASVRAGNVIGGGDWAADRLMPDFLRAVDAGELLTIRSPHAIRPWQHVLEPLSGYLLLAEKLMNGNKGYSGGWNFGPNDFDSKSVSWIVERLRQMIPSARWKFEEQKQPHEAGILKLDSSKAKSQLGWSPRWTLEVALEKTIAWHQAWKQGESMAEYSVKQIAEYLGNN